MTDLKNVNVEKCRAFVRSIERLKPLAIQLRFGTEPWATVQLSSEQLFKLIVAIRRHKPQILAELLKEIGTTAREALEAYHTEMKTQGSPAHPYPIYGRDA